MTPDPIIIAILAKEYISVAECGMRGGVIHTNLLMNVRDSTCVRKSMFSVSEGNILFEVFCRREVLKV